MTNKSLREITITYTVTLATYNAKGLVQRNKKLYELFDEVFFQNAETVTGAQILVKDTRLGITGTEEVIL
jgi:hypothetical protein